MKLYTQEQVRQMLSIYMANVLLNVDGKMPTIDEILSYRTPIEIPSDNIIKEAANGNIDGYNGAMWLKYNYIIKKKS
jgi:hypothetical protein